MANPKPALITQTKLDNDLAKDVLIQPKKTVTYVINVTSADNLNLPYAVAVAGKVQPGFEAKPKRVSGEHGKIVVKNIDPGQQVTLFLNSDAHPSYRKNPVYAVTPNEHDIIVTINELDGKRSETDVPVRAENSKGVGTTANNPEIYTAALTGDIWMKVSHRYSSEEVDGLLPSGTNSIVTEAVKKIYDGLAQPSLRIIVPSSSSGSANKTILVTFDDGENPRENIKSGYDILKEGLKRAHPAGYAAIFTAAIDAGVEKIAMTSAWRPMLGSIAHRAGLGLDVNFVGGTRINRQELRKKDAIDTSNVSLEEKSLFSTFEKSKLEQAKAAKQVSEINSLIKKVSGSPEKLLLAKAALADATAALDAASKAKKEVEAAWNAERDKNEPEAVRLFRSSLNKCDRIAQLFDPWFMDSDTRDKIAGVPNMQHDANEKLHAHHLHVTVYEPRIL